MKEIKAFKDALHHASNDTSRLMTAQIRSEAHASGWPSSVIRRMKVTHKDGSFDVHVHEKDYDKALDLEYGTPDTQPTAALRRFNNRTHDAEDFLLGRISKALGDM